MVVFRFCSSEYSAQNVFFKTFLRSLLALAYIYYRLHIVKLIQ